MFFLIKISAVVSFSIHLLYKFIDPHAQTHCELDQGTQSYSRLTPVRLPNLATLNNYNTTKTLLTEVLSQCRSVETFL